MILESIINRNILLTAFVRSSTYQLIKTGGETWDPSRQLCIDIGMDLAMIKDNAELDVVKTNIASVGG